MSVSGAATDTPSKVVECLLFYNELDMLYYHLSVMYDHVDHFVLVESTHTFRGNEKPLFYLHHAAKKEKDMFAKFADKIVHVVLDTPPHPDAWANEREQRAQFNTGLSQLQLAPHDWLFILDVDEVINPALVDFLRTLPHSERQPFCIPTDFYIHNMESRHKAQWVGTNCTTHGAYVTELSSDAHQFRMSMWGSKHATVPRPSSLEVNGWHMSYLGDAEFIRNKLQNFSHAEYSGDEFTRTDVIAARIASRTHIVGDKLDYVPLAQNSRLPPAIKLPSGAWFPYTPVNATATTPPVCGRGPVRILNLVLYSEGVEHERAMYSLSRMLYDSLEPAVCTVYYTYTSSTTVPTYNQGERLLQLPGVESVVPGTLEKTWSALHWACAHFPAFNQFDYVVRTNISTIVNFNALAAALREKEQEGVPKPKPVDYAGGYVLTLKHLHAPSGITDPALFGLRFAGGTCIIWSAACARYMLSQGSALNRTIVDDVALGLLMQHMGVTPVEFNERFYIYSEGSFQSQWFDPRTLHSVHDVPDEQVEAELAQQGRNALMFRHKAAPRHRAIDVALMRRTVRYVLQWNAALATLASLASPSPSPSRSLAHYERAPDPDPDPAPAPAPAPALTNTCTALP